jgi:SAM-dependent methyltransferase
MHQEALSHVELFCTNCRAFEGRVIQHRLMLIPETTNGVYVITGCLECTNCKKRYPIVDGVPMIIQGTSGCESNVAQYLDAHYGNINTQYWLEMNSVKAKGLTLDAGCSVGRYTFECAKEGFAVGLDVNFEHLKMAAEIQRTGEITYNRKTRALSVESIVSGFIPSNNVMFIAADIHNPPFKMDTFDFISALNVIDSVSHPLTALGQIDAMLKPEGTLFLSTPYAWNPGISEEWLETKEIEPHQFVKLLLTGEKVPECGFNYRIIEQKRNIPWYLRTQDTLEFTYLVDKIVAEKY